MQRVFKFRDRLQIYNVCLRDDNRVRTGHGVMILNCKNCQFSQPVAGGVWPRVCRCGTRYADASDAGTTPKPTPPGLGRQMVNYTLALAKWTAAGCPVREPDEVARLRAVCLACDWYDPDGKACSHRGCGCAVGSPSAFGDKLSWDTEHCPIGKW